MSGTRFRFENWAISHEGCVRELNEDRYLMEQDRGVWLVADGMGGHEAGEVASASIVEHVSSIGKASSRLDLQARFFDRLTQSNSEIQRISRERNGATIGATVVALLIFDGQFDCIWSGDSRVYLLRRGSLSQLSRDHTEVQELLDRGVISPEEAEDWPRKNVITRAVGVMPEPMIDVSSGDVEINDTFVLCSDGLTAHVADQEILEIVNGRKAREACELLIDLALQRGGTDNVTVVVVQCRNADATVPVDFPAE